MNGRWQAHDISKSTSGIRWSQPTSTREQNERKFGQWSDLPDGGRNYWLEVQGRHGWRARYLKMVNADEQTIRFWQEIYDETGTLVETHVKFPMDEGHRKV